MSAKDKQVGGSHYKNYAIQPVEFITRNDLGYLEGCVIKRMCRWQAKGGVEDLRKAIHEIELLIELTETTEKTEHQVHAEMDKKYGFRPCTCGLVYEGKSEMCRCPIEAPQRATPEEIAKAAKTIERVLKPQSRMGVPPQFRDDDDNREAHRAYANAVKLLHELGYRYIRAGDYGEWAYRSELVPPGPNG